MMRRIAVYLILSTLLFPGFVFALEVPENLAASPAKDGIRLEWTMPAGKGVKSVSVYRSDADPGAGFRQLARVSKKNTYLDATAKPGDTYYYYVVANGADGSKSDQSAIVSATAGGANDPGGDRKPRAGRSWKAVVDFGAKMVNFEPHTVAFAYDPRTGEGGYTDNGEKYQFGAWRTFEPFRLPPECRPGCQVTFGAQPKSFACWVWDPETGDLWYSSCLDTVRWREFQKFEHPLPKAPNHGPDTVVRFDNTQGFMFFVSYNPKDGSLYLSKSTGDMWTNWTPFGTLVAPPNYRPGSTHFGFGAIQSEFRGKEKIQGTYWMFAYSDSASTLHVAHKNDMTEWNGWESTSNLFKKPAVLGGR